MNAAAFKLAVIRSEALLNYYQAERRAGTCPDTAHDRMVEFAKRLDAQFDETQAAVKTEMERVS